MKSYNPHRTASYKVFNITPHARQRAFERFGITTENEIKKIAHSARYKGICAQSLTYENYSLLGLDYNTYLYLKNKYGAHRRTDKAMFYKDMVFVFGGSDSRTLKSIIPCTPEIISSGVAKLMRNPEL